MVRDHLLEVIREFTSNIVNPYDLDELLHRLMGHATDVVDASGAGVMLARDGGQLHSIAASEERIVSAEQQQAELQSGACFEAYHSDRLIVVEDLEAETRWPRYAEHVAALGLRAVLGIPMHACGQRIGVMNVYRDAPTRWTDEQIAMAEVVTVMGAGYILSANQLRAQHTMGEQLQAAIESRDVIGQAKGLVMAREQVGADAAFEQLRTRSQQRNRKLREVAQDIIDEHESTR